MDIFQVDIFQIEGVENYIYLAILLGGILLFILLVVALIKVIKVLAKLNKVIDKIDKKIDHAQKALDSLSNLEVEAQKTLKEFNENSDKFFENVSFITTELVETLKDYRLLENNLEIAINEDVRPILHEVKGTMSEVHQVAKGIRNGVESAENLFEAVDEAGKTVKTVTQIAKAGLTGVAVQFASMAVGVKTALEYIGENLNPKHSPKEVKKDE